MLQATPQALITDVLDASAKLRAPSRLRDAQPRCSEDRRRVSAVSAHWTDRVD